MLTLVFALAALAAGITGAWSPCGFSMVETLAPAGYAGRLRTTLVACATFTAGALVGGVITFGGLGLLGQWLGSGGTGAVAVAVAVAIAAATNGAFAPSSPPSSARAPKVATPPTSAPAANVAHAIAVVRRRPA